MSGLTIPHISIYSVTGADYGKELDQIFDPPGLYRFFPVMTGAIGMLRALTPGDEAMARRFEQINDWVDEVLGSERIEAAALDIFGQFAVGASEVAEIVEDETWKADVESFHPPGMALAYAILLAKGAWSDSRMAGVRVFLLTFARIGFLRRAIGAIQSDVSLGDEKRTAALANLARQGEIVGKLEHYMKRVASNDERFALYPPPEKDERPMVISSDAGTVEMRVLRDGSMLNGPPSREKYEDVYYPGSSPVQ